MPQHRINVDVSDGLVTLTGSVPHLRAYGRAERRAEFVRGVRGVINRLEVVPDGRSDASIYKDVLAAVTSHPATEHYDVDLRIVGGEVTLLGTVDSWAQRDLVESVAAGVRGVTAVHNEVDVDYDENRSDDEIRAEVKARLDNDIRVFSDQIKVEVDDGVVVLSGSISGAAERRSAYSDAWVAGVSEVDTEGLEVRWWEKHIMRRLGNERQAAVIDERAKDALDTALSVDPRMMAAHNQIQVRVVRGTATLTGDVPSSAAKYAAEQDALNIVGIWRVRNLLRVRPVPLVTDDELEERVEAALERNPYIDHLDLRVYVDNGEATLLGSVENEFHRREARWVASRVKGVTSVRDATAVTASDSPTTDFELRANVLEQLAWDPFVDAQNVSVDIHDGVATLSGTVQDWRAHDAAIRNARGAGVERIVDDLRVEDGPMLFAPLEK